MRGARGRAKLIGVKCSVEDKVVEGRRQEEEKSELVLMLTTARKTVVEWDYCIRLGARFWQSLWLCNSDIIFPRFAPVFIALRELIKLMLLTISMSKARMLGDYLAFKAC